MQAQPTGSAGRAGAAARARRRAGVTVLVAVLAAAGIAAGLAATSGSSGRGAANVTTASLATFHSAMVARLESASAHFAWVVCVRSGARFEGVPVVRCNVDFGDPHIQAFCSVFRGGRLVTNADDPAIPCRPDDAGYSQTIQSYN